uniref:PH domain-containing protein n=1 Tax=Gasterosteus aculeatus aculeatus TaxID=481459 RepID=A0AAQ4S3A1_GASAC
MNGKVNNPSERITHSKSANMVSDLSTETQPYTRTSRTPRTAATFGKRSNSMRRNPKAEVTKHGWLHKQASSGVKQWNKRWFVLTDRCLFYYKDEKEDTVLGSLPLLSFQIKGVEPSDNITRKFAFKVRLEKEPAEDAELKDPLVFCMQAQHAGTRTYYFSADSHEEQKEWIKAMNEAAEVNIQQTQRMNTIEDPNHTMATKATNQQTQQPPHTQRHCDTDIENTPHPKINVLNSPETPTPSTPCSKQAGKNTDGRKGEGEVEGEGPVPDNASHPSHHPNGWGSNGLRNAMPLNSNNKPPASRSHSQHCAPQGHPGGGVSPSYDPTEQQDNVVLRRGFVPRTAPERVAQRKTSMVQLQQWVNHRRTMASQEDIHSLSSYYPVNHGVLDDYFGYPGGPPYMEEYPLYPPGMRPDSICSVSALGGYNRRWTFEEKRHSLRDRSQLYGSTMPRDQWAPTYCGGMETSMRRLSIQPRSRSVPRSPSLSSGGPYSPVPHNFASPARSTSGCFNRFPGRMREDVIYADPSVYSLRRSLSPPKYDCPGYRRSLSQGLYNYNYPVTPSIRNKMTQEDILDLQLQRNLDYLDQQVPPFYEVFSRELHPTLKLNEIETSKLLSRLCEQNGIWKEHEAVVHRLRMEKDSLEEALVITHQELELFHTQPLALDKLRLKKDTLQNQLVNIRGQLSQASSALTTSRMEFEALEDEANAIHGDLWEQLNAGGQSELVHRHIQKEFWRVQDVLEGLHKNNSSRGTDTAKHKVASGASGSFSTNSPASPLSSVSFTSPLSPFSPVPGSQVSPTKQLGPESGFAEQNISDVQDQSQDRQSTMNKVGIVPPRTKSPTDKSHSSSTGDTVHNGRCTNGILRERPKSAVFPAELKSKMSVEEQNERIRRHQSSSVRDKRRSLNLSGGQSPANYKVIRRRLTAHEIDINDLEAAVRGQGQESPREEIARLRRLRIEPEAHNLGSSKELVTSNKVVIPERYMDVEEYAPLSPEEQKEKQKKLVRIKTLIAKSNLQNMVPLLDGPGGGRELQSIRSSRCRSKRSVWRSHVLWRLRPLVAAVFSPPSAPPVPPPPPAARTLRLPLLTSQTQPTS